eukprot:1161909-Pelagomonas_calceolata.AAC.8
MACAPSAVQAWRVMSCARATCNSVCCTNIWSAHHQQWKLFRRSVRHVYCASDLGFRVPNKHGLRPSEARGIFIITTATLAGLVSSHAVTAMLGCMHCTHS